MGSPKNGVWTLAAIGILAINFKHLKKRQKNWKILSSKLLWIVKYKYSTVLLKKCNKHFVLLLYFNQKKLLLYKVKIYFFSYLVIIIILCNYMINQNFLDNIRTEILQRHLCSLGKISIFKVTLKHARTLLRPKFRHHFLESP